MLTSCTTMNQAEKQQHLAEYEKLSRQKALDLFGADSPLFLTIAKNIANAENTQVVNKNLMYASTASIMAIGDQSRIEQHVKMDVQAVSETFTGHEIKTIVQVFKSPEGQAFRQRSNQLRTQYILDVIAKPAAEREAIYQVFSKEMEQESIKLAPSFNTPLGRDALRKWNSYLKTKKSYQDAYRKNLQPLTLKEFVRRVQVSGKRAEINP